MDESEVIGPFCSKALSCGEADRWLGLAQSATSHFPASIWLPAQTATFRTVVIISAANVLLPARVEPNTEVVFEGGRIVAIRPASGRPDCQLLAPGLIDLQVNGHADIDVATMELDDLPQMHRLLASQGVTSWYPTLITATDDVYDERLEFFGRLVSQPDASWPQVCGVHLEGPYLGEWHGAHRGVREGPIDIDWIRGLPEVVRIMTLGPERPNAVEAIEVLTAKGVVVALGHTGATFDQMRAAIDAGARLVTHCFNAMAPFHHRDPGPIGASLTSDELAVSMIADNIHIHPAAANLVWRAKPSDKVVLVTDASAWRTGRLGSESIELVDGAPRLPDGVLAGSNLTLSGAVKTSVISHGATVFEALSAATRNPARLMGLTDRGTIEVGARADFTTYDDDLNLIATYVNGDLLDG